MSVVTTQNITQAFLNELSAHSPKAAFMPFDKIARALKYLEEHGIPNSKNEEYKYCNTEAVIRKEFKTLSSAFSPVGKTAAEKFRMDGLCHIFIVNGRLSPELSDMGKLPRSIEVLTLEGGIKKYPALVQKHFGRYADETKDAFIALNTAFAGDGIFVRVTRDNRIPQPVRFVYLSSAEENVAEHFRKFFIVEEGAHFMFSEAYETTQLHGRLFSNHLMELHAGKDAGVHHELIQAGSENFYGINTTQVNQEEKSRYSINTFVFGGSLVRNNLSIVVSGERAETHLNGLCIADKNQVVDNHTLVDHAVPNCESSELYKGIAAGRSSLTFNGKIFVRRDAQKINAYQSSKNILMSDDASINTKPQLEIFANDVKCSHGTSTGKVDEEAMFYLKSRGIGDSSARKLLLHAFAAEVVEKLNNESLKNKIEEKITAALEF